jgi:predicted ester cyclase
MSQMDTNKSVVRRLLEGFLSCGDPALVDQVLAPEFTDHSPSNPGLSGRDNLKRSVSDWCVAFPDTHTIVDDLIAEADVVAARWTSTATHRGPFLGIRRPAPVSRLPAPDYFGSRTAGSSRVGITSTPWAWCSNSAAQSHVEAFVTTERSLSFCAAPARPPVR